MPPLKDLTGKRFGELTVVRRDYSRGPRTFYWVQCSCGKRKDKSVDAGSLRSGATQSCGHLSRDNNGRRRDLTGKTFGELTVLGQDGHKGLDLCWRVRCTCGKEKITRGALLRTGKTQSCGHLHKVIAADRMRGTQKRLVETIHAALPSHMPDVQSNIPEYQSYKAMLNRCYSPKHNWYHLYGGRGIAVCDRWLESFANFYEDMGPKPTPKHSIDRLNNDLGYCKENCRWATPKEQSNNQRPRKPLANRSSSKVPTV